MDIAKEIKKAAGKIDKDDAKKAANKALESKAADKVMDKVKGVDKKDVKSAINKIL